jgi:hypothetical protein
VAKRKEMPAPAETPIIQEEPEIVVEMQPLPEENLQMDAEVEKFFPGGY